MFRHNVWIATKEELAFMVACLALATVSATATADIRIQNHRFDHICRLVAWVEDARGSRVVYDGPIKRGQYKDFKGEGSRVCISRSSVPQRCNSELTRPVCKVDKHNNRTISWTIN